MDRQRRNLAKIKAIQANQAKKPGSSEKKTSHHPGVPLLTGGPDTNLMLWKKRVGSLLQIEYGDFSRFTSTNEHFEIAPIEFDADDLTAEADPFGFNRDDIKVSKAERTKKTASFKAMWAPCYALIESLLSPEIEAAIKQLDGYELASTIFDPLLLYILAIEAATGDGPCVNKPIADSSARSKYNTCKMQSGETITEFHERFTFVMDQMKEFNDVIIVKEDETEEVRLHLSDRSSNSNRFPHSFGRKILCIQGRCDQQVERQELCNAGHP